MGTIPKRTLVPAWIFSRLRLKKVRLIIACLYRDHVDAILRLYRARYGEFRADLEPILARIARSHSRNRGSNGARTRTAIVDHGNPGAWHGTSATAPATIIACANDAEVLDGLLGALDSH